MHAMISRILGISFAMFLAGAMPNAAAKDTPSALAGVTVVNAAKVQEMMRAGVAVYDARVAAEYAEAHIKGAKSLPYREKSAKDAGFDKTQDDFALDKLPSDKGTPLIFYCNAGECWKSYKASKVAKDAGYQRIYWYRDGIPDWRSKGLPVE